jgi:hypothetical protein
VGWEVMRDLQAEVFSANPDAAVTLRPRPSPATMLTAEGLTGSYIANG